MMSVRLLLVTLSVAAAAAASAMPVFMPPEVSSAGALVSLQADSGGGGCLATPSVSGARQDNSWEASLHATLKGADLVSQEAFHTEIVPNPFPGAQSAAPEESRPANLAVSAEKGSCLSEWLASGGLSSR